MPRCLKLAHMGLRAGVANPVAVEVVIELPLADIFAVCICVRIYYGA